MTDFLIFVYLINIMCRVTTETVCTQSASIRLEE